MIAKEPVIDIDHILVSASAADYSPTIHAELGKVVAEELELREALRAAQQQQQPKSGGGGKGGGNKQKSTKAFSSYFERLMDTEMRQRAMGRSPPCAMCGRICHFSFALPSTCSSASSSVSPVAAGNSGNKRGRNSSRSPVGGGVPDAEAAVAAMEEEVKDAWESKVPVACLRHLEALIKELDLDRSKTGVVLFTRYDDERLEGMAEEAAKKATRAANAMAEAEDDAENAAVHFLATLKRPKESAYELPEAVANAVEHNGGPAGEVLERIKKGKGGAAVLRRQC